jgi:hypothetical protein
MVRILSKSMDEPLTLTMRIKKRFHFLICCWCQRYEEQLHYLRDVSGAFPEHADQATEAAVSPAAKERWKNALRTAPALAASRDVEADGDREVVNRSSRSWWAPWNFPILAMTVLLLFFALRPVWTPSSKRSVADFRSGLVSVIGVPPSLDFESAKLSEVTAWLRQSGRNSEFPIPQKVANHSTAGCRIFNFHGRDVTLICFRREQGGLIHLFVVEGRVIPGLPNRQDADVAQQGEWMTAAWSDARHDYLLAVQGDEALVKKLLAGL